MVGALPCDILMHENRAATATWSWRPSAWRLVRAGSDDPRPRVSLLRSGRPRPQEDKLCLKVRRGTGVDKGPDGILYKNVLASYTHLHSLGSPGWAEEELMAFVRSKTAAN